MSTARLPAPISLATKVPPGKEKDFEAARFLLEELLKKKRYSKLGLSHDDINAIASEAVTKPLPEKVGDRLRILEERLKEALDDRAASLASAARPVVPPGPVEIKKLPPGHERKELHYDYKSKSRKPIPFSRLNFDDEKYSNVEDYLGQELYKLERKHGSESEQSREAREAQETAIERAAGTIRLAPVLESVSKICNGCGEPIPGEAKRFVILRAELPCVGLEVTAVEYLGVMCEKCQDKQATGDAKAAPPDESWMEGLSANEREAWRLREDGLNQTEIGKKMARSQETISRMLKSADAKRKAALRAKLQSTGGA